MPFKVLIVEKQKTNYFNIRFISLRGRYLIRLPVVIKVDFASFLRLVAPVQFFASKFPMQFFKKRKNAELRQFHACQVGEWTEN